MYTVSYDPSKNRIFIRVIGNITPEEMKDYIQDTVSLIDTAQPGFTVCANMEQSHRDTLNNSAAFQGIREYAINKQMGKVATILNEQAYAIHQHTPFVGVKNVFLNQEQAEDFLDH